MRYDSDYGSGSSSESVSIFIYYEHLINMVIEFILPTYLLKKLLNLKKYKCRYSNFF